ASEQVIVVTGGDAVDAARLTDLPLGALVIAADSGIDQALALGLHVDVAVGDFDSVSPDALRRVRAAGAEVERHPEAKDETDLELALDAAIERGARRVHVLGGHGGRLDHFLANALLLASPRYAGVEIVAWMGAALVTVVRDAAALMGRPGDLVTLLAVHGPATGVTTEGLRYPLDGDVLLPGSTRGVSNQLLDTTARVSLSDGVLIVVQPGPGRRPPEGT
ncbi:MAG: thiamine diphosphokinase, partial [Microthrixaceae bacterium]